MDVAYLALPYSRVRALAGAQASNLTSRIGLVVAARLVVPPIGGGICLGTIAIIAGSLGGPP